MSHNTSAGMKGELARDRPDWAANLAFFLQEKTGTIFGQWAGRLSAGEQRGLFGRFLGKGQIIIDGSTETLLNRVKVCFGLDSDDRSITAWRDL